MLFELKAREEIATIVAMVIVVMIVAMIIVVMIVVIVGKMIVDKELLLEGTIHKVCVSPLIFFSEILLGINCIFGVLFRMEFFWFFSELLKTSCEFCEYYQKSERINMNFFIGI